MDGRAKRGESLAGKTIALAAVLVTLLAAGTLLSACAQQRTTSQFAVAQLLSLRRRLRTIPKHGWTRSSRTRSINPS